MSVLATGFERPTNVTQILLHEMSLTPSHTTKKSDIRNNFFFLFCRTRVKSHTRERKKYVDGMSKKASKY